MRQGLWYPQEKVWKDSETTPWKRPLEWVFLAVRAPQPEVMPLLSKASLFQEWQGLQGLQTLHSSFGLNSSNAVKTPGPRVSCSCWLENSIKVHLFALCTVNETRFVFILPITKLLGRFIKSLCQRDECEVIRLGHCSRAVGEHWPRASTALVHSWWLRRISEKCLKWNCPQQSSVQPFCQAAVSVCLPRDMKCNMYVLEWEEQQNFFRWREGFQGELTGAKKGCLPPSFFTKMNKWQNCGMNPNWY